MAASFLTAPALSALPHIRHAFFTRQGGVSEGIYASLIGGLGSNDERARVAENRARMLAVLGVDGPLLSVHQVHSPTVVTARAAFAGERPKADGMVTDRPGLALSVSTADCGPVLFADRSAGVIGAAHAGWRGALDGVLEATIAAMVKLGAAREHIVAAVGPLIRQQSYEVGPEFVAQFRAAVPDAARFFAPGAGDRAQFDLPGFLAMRLEAAGIAAIEDLKLDTYPDSERFYSYRRSVHRGEPDYGRLIAAIALAP